jgi:hypothetical protein
MKLAPTAFPLVLSEAVLVLSAAVLVIDGGGRPG